MATSSSVWHTRLDQPFPGCTATQWEWLTSIDSLTARLRSLSANTAHIKLLSAGWADTEVEEAVLLTQIGVAAYPVWIREMIHYRHQAKLIWGRAVIPAATLEKTGLKADTVQSIGDILFHDPSLRRTELALAKLTGHHPYYRRATSHLADFQQPVWARRSILWFQQQPLLVAEIFLPDFFTYEQST